MLVDKIHRSKFKFLDYLRGDLRRNLYILHKNSPMPSGVFFWLRMLSWRFFPVLLFRISSLFYKLKLKVFAKIFSFINFFVFGIEIAISCDIGPGLFFPHTQGTVIGAWKIGKNAIIFQGVTIGARDLDAEYNEKYRPILKDNITVGSGAKILGDITINDDSIIGANAVVLTSVPPYSLAVGIPARILSRSKEQTKQEV